MFRMKHAVRATALIVVAACSNDAGNPLAPGGEPLKAISDAAHAGAVPGFYFLPPMVTQPAYSGTFDAGVSPRVEICELAGNACAAVLVEYTLSSGLSLNAGAENYQANWPTQQFDLDVEKHYRISVYAGAVRLGFADVDVVGSGKDLKNVQTQEFIPLLDGRTLPIKFRIETGIVGQVVVSPDSADIAVGATQQFTATLLDLHGNPIAGPPVTWSSLDEAVATVDGTGLATGVGVGATTITATAQAASGSAVLTVFNPNEPPVAVADTFDAIGNFTVPVSAPGVLANDTDPDGDPLSAVAGTYPTAQGGTFTLHADGSFTYLSAAGFTGVDEVSYEITDGQASASSTATFLVPTRVWYVDNASAAPGDGRDASPFAALKSAEAASLAGETMFVLHGDGTTAGLDEGIVLKNGQSLTGQGIPSSVTASLNGETVVLLVAGSAPTITRGTAGTTLALAQDNTVQGLDVASTAGAGISGSGFGTLAAGHVSVAATGGPSLDLSNGTAAAAFAELSSAGSAGTGLRLVNVTGILSAPAGSIAGAAGTGVEVSGGSANVTYGGNVASVGPRPVAVTGRTGGTLTLSGTIASTGQGILVQGNGGGTIAFTGASKSLSTGAGDGVELASNAGATVQFAGGGLAVATTTGDAFRAFGGGVVTVTGAGNTLVSAGGAALRVANATIGAVGLTFRSISATGGASGILLQNTGASNGLQVTGTGTAASGGTITGTTGPGMSFSSTRNIWLSHMVVAGAGGSGVAGAGVTGFSLEGSLVQSSGSAATHAGLDFAGLFGTGSIMTSTVTGSSGHNVRVANTSGTLDLSVSGSAINSNGSSGGDGFRLEVAGSAAASVQVSGSTFAAHRGNHFHAAATGASTLHVAFTGNGLSGGHASALGQGVSIMAGDAFSGTVTYEVTDNTINGAITTAVLADLGLSTGAASFSGAVRNNQIGTSGMALSCSAQGAGISLDTRGQGTYTVAVTGNALRQCFDRGIQAQANDGSGVMNLTVTGNVVSELAHAFSREAFFLNAGSFDPNVFGVADAHTVCLDLGGAGSLSNLLAGGPSASADMRLRQRFATTVQLPGYAGSNTDGSAVGAYLSARNGGASASVQVTSPPGGGYVGGAACPQP
jgi:hypothetical protein